MRKHIFIYISFVLIFTFWGAVYAEQKAYTTINSVYAIPIDGNLKATNDTKDYRCDLSTLQRDTLYYNNQHQFGDTIKLYSVCIKEYPDKANLYNNRGNVYKMLKKYDNALVDYDKAILLNPKYVTPYAGKMSLFILKSKFDDALSLSDEILKLEPKFANIYCQRGIIYSLQKDFDNAIANLSIAIKYEPKRIPSAYYYRGNAYFKKADYKLAIKDYKKCIKLYQEAEANSVALLDYSLGDVYRNLGFAYVQVEDYENALACLLGAAKYYEAAGNKSAKDDIEEFIFKVYTYYKGIKN